MDTRCPGQDLRSLRPDDVFEERCPACGAAVEFFKTDRSRRCAACGVRFRNPRFDAGCVAWCAVAAECIDRRAHTAGAGSVDPD